MRHTDALTGGAGAIMFRDDMKPLEPDNFLYQPFLHARGLGEKDLSLALALGEAVSVDLPLAELALERLAAGLGVPHTRRKRREMDELRRKGLEKMNEVYAGRCPTCRASYFALTVEHLFGRIWTRPGLSMRDRRMMLIAVLTTLNQEDLLEIQVNAVLHNEELTREELREMAVFLTHYVGFPLGSKLDGVIETSNGQTQEGRG